MVEEHWEVKLLECVLNQYRYFQKSFSEGSVFECGITCLFLAFVTSRGTFKDLGKIGVLLFSLKLCIGLGLMGWLFFNSCFLVLGNLRSIPLGYSLSSLPDELAITWE